MTTTASSSRHQCADSMRALIEAYLREPGITRQAFCTRHQISCSTFHYHLAQYRRQQAQAQEKPAGRFIPLALSEPTALPVGASACEIGRRARIDMFGPVRRKAHLPNVSALQLRAERLSS